MNSTEGNPLEPVYQPAMQDGNVTVGISGEIGFNSSAMLTVAILGSIRTIRDFTKGPSILQPQIQSVIKYSYIASGGVSLSRLWLDNIAMTTLSFVPMNSSQISVLVTQPSCSFREIMYSMLHSTIHS